MSSHKPKTLLYIEPNTSADPTMTMSLDPNILERLDIIEAKLLCFEEYFNSIESTLARIQQVFIAMQEGKL